MKFSAVLALLLLTSSISAFAKIEDNSFLLEEAFNQEYGVYQFIQKYQTDLKDKKTFDYAFENEIPLTDKVHQFSYEIPVAKTNEAKESGVGDISLNYRWQPVNTGAILLAERIGLILPTGSVAEETGNGVYGLEFMQAATIHLNESFVNHYNFGFTTLPDAETSGHNKKRTISSFSAGTSLIYLAKDNFNLMFEALVESGQEVDATGAKTAATTVTLNPGVRFAYDFDWKETQIVPGVSFPVDVISSRTSYGALLYLSIEPKFY